MLQEIDSLELSKWIAFYSVEPFGDEWRQTGQLCAVTANVWKSKGKPFAPDDWMPIAKQRQTAAEHKTAFLRAIKTPNNPN